MKRMLMFLAVVITVSVLSVGCSTGSSFDRCRLGSLWPSSRTSHAGQVYLDGGSACNPCEQVSCNPCDPCPDPCHMSCVPAGGINLPGPTM